MKAKIFGTLLIIIVSVMAFNFTVTSKSESKTIENLKAAIIGETTASAKYLAYSKKAKEEGLDNYLKQHLSQRVFMQTTTEQFLNN